MQVKELDKTLIDEEKVICVNSSNKTCLMCGQDLGFRRVWDFHTLTHPSSNLCKTCSEWYMKVREINNRSCARIDGECYTLNPRGGSKLITTGPLTISFNDGRLVTAARIWHQGRIPLIWRRYLPDNAEFVN